MPKFPEPAEVALLAKIEPAIFTLEAGKILYRIFFSGGDHPVFWNTFRFFGPVGSRFDHHEPDIHGRPHTQSRGIMYAAYGAQAIPTCLAEVFQTTRIIDRESRSPVLCAFKLQRDIALLDLTGTFTTWIGASMAINSGPRPRARRWSRHLYEAYPGIDGLLYSSSMYGNHPALALYERASDVPSRYPEFHRTLNDPALLPVISGTSRVIRYRFV